MGASLEEKIGFLVSSPMFADMLHTLAASISLSVFDLECLNQVLSKMRVSGRMPDFATVAAKVFIKEALMGFQRRYGHRVGDGDHRAAADVVRKAYVEACEEEPLHHNP